MNPRVIASALAFTLIAGVAVPASATVECHGMMAAMGSGHMDCPLCHPSNSTSTGSGPQVKATCCTARSSAAMPVLGSPEQRAAPHLLAGRVAFSAARHLVPGVLTAVGAAVRPLPPPLQRVLPLLD